MAAKPILIVQHDKTNPPGTLPAWLAQAGAEVELLRPQEGAQIPNDLSPYAGIILLGGSQSAYSDKRFEWRSATLELLQRAAAEQLPTLGLCLSAQLIAQALGGVVERGPEGLELGPMQIGRKDASYKDELFDTLPMAPDVIQFHGDAITELPPGAVLLMGGPLYENQAFRVGERMWALQGHIETTPEMFESWVRSGADALTGKGYDVERLVAMSQAVHPELEETWTPFIARFVHVATGQNR